MMQRGGHLEWHVVGKITEIVSRVQPRAFAQLYGSMHMGTYLPSSDYDIMVNTYECINLCEVIDELRKHVSSPRGWHLVTGPFPVIRGAVTASDGTTRQVNIATGNSSSSTFAASVFVANVLCANMATLKPIVLLLKQLLRACHLTAEQGGLSAYAITLMVAATIYTNEKETVPMDHAADVLIRFLDHWTQQPTSDLAQAVVVSEYGGSRRLWLQPMNRATMDYAEVYVQDPVSSTMDNIARGCYRFSQIVGAFRMLRKEIMKQVCIGTASSVRDVQKLLLHTVIRYHVSHASVSVER